MPPHFEKEKAKKTIKLMLEKLKTEADPQLLSKYRSLFKKEVSFFRRSWAAAYLLLLSDQGAAGRFEKNRSRKFGGAGREQDKPGRSSGQRSRTRPDDGNRTEKAPYPLADEDSRRLFISVGRNRRVFPREILGIINAKTAIPKEDIGAIRILDNYSFVQVRDTVADTIIEALNGQNFRGRVLTVSYARARKEGAGEPDEYEYQDSGAVDDEAGTVEGVDTAAPAGMDDGSSEDWRESAGDRENGGSWDEPQESGADGAEEYSGEEWEEPAERVEALDEPESSPEQDEDHPDKEGI
jgi:hypothetical protein